jgi:transcriptional regulator with XRE-family HTH domain
LFPFDITRKGKANIKDRFGFAIKQRRNDLGISQEELAHRAGLHRTYIGDVERGGRNRSLENIQRLAAALEISIADLLTEYGVEEDRK